MHIDNLIYNFSQKNLIQFLRQKIKTFKPDEDDLSYLFKDDIFDKYESIDKIGEATIKGDDLIIIASKTSDPLTEKSGKKNQYEIAKKVLKEEVKDAAIFVFYDDEGNFRFSFVNANYLGTKRNYSDFKRYTYFVNKDKQNNTFKRQVGDCSFNSLEDIIKAFSVEPLNKQFYQEISKAFYALIGGKINIASKKYDFEPVLELPSTPYSDRKRYQEFAVRLIGRTIFCWFLKNKKSINKLPLIPENWLQSDTVEMLNNGGYNYYHDYLEKLFFLILNKKVENREDYDLPDGHETIPFLNGGLFEPHTDDFFPKDSNGIHKISYNLKIPNNWFFELFKVLEQFNFTIDENSINDAEVSIDPEMLGTIFENLLAEIDPDTEKSARKATGSFYTPREIVDYMVEQSIIQYLKTKTSITDEVALQNLFKEGGENEFEEKQTIEILEALNTVKILDPACGSGAYPMGALHKIITILHKLDPEAHWWKEKQINSNRNAIIRKAVREELSNKNADYIRKLGVIQNSIYGVDIQPIATEIAKLRSFLSLIIDENIIDEAENRGIEPLPNLEFKFVTANTLIGLPEETGQQGLFNNFEELELLEQLRTDYLQSSGKKKTNIKKRFLKVQQRAFTNQNNLFANHESRAYKLMSWNPFKDDASSWFDPQWMYGVDKFDIIIGNPPYITYKGKERIDISKEQIQKLVIRYKNSSEYKINSYALFTELGVDLLVENGVLSYIIPSTILQNEYLKKIREYLLAKHTINSIISFENKVFNAVTDSIILNVSNNHSVDSITKVYRKNNLNFSITDEYTTYDSIKWLRKEDDFVMNIKLSKNDELISKKIKSGSETIGDYLNVYVGIVAKGIKRFLSNTEDSINHKRYLQGKHIQNYKILENHIFINFIKEQLHSNNDETVYLQEEKILVRKTGNKLIAVIDNNQYFTDQSIYNLYPKKNKKVNLKYVSALLNSKLLDFYFNKNMITNPDIFPYIKGIHLKKLPYKFNLEISNKIIKYVEEISQTTDVSEFLKLNNIINILIYKVYDLNFNEVLIVDPEFKLTQEEYENYNIADDE